MSTPANPTCRYVATDRDGTSYCTLAAHAATGYDRGYDDGYQAATADEQAIDARNRQHLDELRAALTDACTAWARSEFSLNAASRMYDAAIAIAQHCAPRSEP